MVEKVREEVLVAIRKRLATKGVSADTDFSAYPVGGIFEAEVPFVGTIHIPAKRVISRAESDKSFKNLKR